MPDLIAAMSLSSFYPHRPSQVEWKQTHISHVFLAGRYVYKVKKPVSFPFLDYSSLANRLHFCNEEIRLNRRLAPEIYLDVVPIYANGKQFVLSDAAARTGSDVVEYTVKMQRLPEERMLDRLLHREAVQSDDISVICKKLSAFHQAASSERSAIYGTASAIQKQTSENLSEIEPFVGKSVQPRLFNAIKRFNEDFFHTRQDLFDRRLRQHKVREGHGDLRAEHVCMTEAVVIFDCIEFNEAFRYGDVASEIAFLTMDFDFLHAADFAESLPAIYAAQSGDPELVEVLSFYKCYRACVRGKVESLKGLDDSVPKQERDAAFDRARRYFRLAYRYTRPAPRPALLVVCGLVATGKSTLARMLEDLTGFKRMNSDVIRKSLAPVAREPAQGTLYGHEIYDKNQTDKTYAALRAAAAKGLSEGRGTIIDASFKEMRHRRMFLDEAESKNVPIVFIECQADQNEVFHRLQKRKKQKDEVSDATWEIYQRQRRQFIPLTEVSNVSHVTFESTNESAENLLSRIENLWAAGHIS